MLDMPEGRFTPPIRIYGRNDVFDHCVRRINRIWNTERYHILGLIGTPFSGKRTLAGALKSWFHEETKLKCISVEWDMKLPDVDEKAIVFIYDIERRTDEDQIFAMSSKEDIFVVYTSCTDLKHPENDESPIRVGGRVYIRELDRESAIQMISYEAGLGRALVERCMQEPGVEVPSSPFVLRYVCDEIRRKLNADMSEKDKIATVFKIMDREGRCEGAGNLISDDESKWWLDRFKSLFGGMESEAIASAWSRGLKLDSYERLVRYSLVESSENSTGGCPYTFTEGARCLLRLWWTKNRTAPEFDAKKSIEAHLSKVCSSSDRNMIKDCVDFCRQIALNGELNANIDFIKKTLDGGIFEEEPLTSIRVLDEIFGKINDMTTPDSEIARELKRHEFCSICRISYSNREKLERISEEWDCIEGCSSVDVCRFYRDTLNPDLMKRESTCGKGYWSYVMARERGPDYETVNDKKIPLETDLVLAELHYLLMFCELHRYNDTSSKETLTGEDSSEDVGKNGMATKETMAGINFGRVQCEVRKNMDCIQEHYKILGDVNVLTKVRASLDLCRIHLFLNDRIEAEHQLKTAREGVRSLYAVPYDVQAGLLDCDAFFYRFSKDYRIARDKIKEALAICADGNLIYQSVILRIRLMMLYKDMGRTIEYDNIVEELRAVERSQGEFKLLCMIVHSSLPEGRMERKAPEDHSIANAVQSTNVQTKDHSNVSK